MKKQETACPNDAACKGRNDRGAEQAEDMTQLVELERRANESPDERSNNERATGIGQGKNRCAGQIAVTEQVGCEGGGDHADDDRPPYGRTERDQDSRGHAGCRPEHRDPVSLVEQGEAETGSEEEGDRDRN